MFNLLNRTGARAAIRGQRLETLVQLHNYFRGINNHSEIAEKIILQVETLILGILEEGPT